MTPRDRSPPKRLRNPSNPEVKYEIDQLFANLLWIRRQIREWLRMSRKARKKTARGMAVVLSALSGEF